jgi:hypothetical protein
MWTLLLQRRFADAAAVTENYPDAALLTPLVHDKVATAAGGREMAVTLLRECFEAHRGAALRRVLAAALIESQRLEEARRLLSEPGTPDEVLERLTHLAFVQQAWWQEAAELGDDLLRTRDDPLIAYNTACSYARLGRTDVAMDRLGAAIDAGFIDRAQFETDPDLDVLRDTPGFTTLLERIDAPARETQPTEPAQEPPGAGSNRPSNGE